MQIIPLNVEQVIFSQFDQVIMMSNRRCYKYDLDIEMRSFTYYSQQMERRVKYDDFFPLIVKLPPRAGVAI